MAKPLATLRRQFARQGWHLLFSFDTSIEPGSIIERKRARDVNQLGSITAYAKLGDLELAGPADIGLLDFVRTHELSVAATAELLETNRMAAAADRAKTVRLSLDRPVKWYVADKIRLFSMLAADRDWPACPQARRLALKRHFLVTDVVRTRLRFTFEGSRGVSLDAETTGLKNLRGAELSGGFRWENRYELATKTEWTIAYEAVRWRRKPGLFETLRA